MGTNTQAHLLVMSLIIIVTFIKPSMQLHNSADGRQCDFNKQKFGFIKRVDKGSITTVKDLES